MKRAETHGCASLRYIMNKYANNPLTRSTPTHRKTADEMNEVVACS